MSDSTLCENSFPELPKELRHGGLWNMLKLFGPGALIASVTIGTGETLFAPRLGSIFGYSVMWVVTATVIFKGVQIYTGARYLVLTGEHPVKAWMNLPGPKGWFPILLLIIILISLPPWVAAIADALANLTTWVTGVGAQTGWGRAAWASFFLIGVLILTQVQSYSAIEKVSLVILGLKLILVFIAVAVVRPDWMKALWHTFVPGLPAYDAVVVNRYPGLAQRPVVLELAAFAGAIGSGLHDYVGYLGMMREKRWGALKFAQSGSSVPQLPSSAEQIALGRRWLRAPLYDTSFSFLSVFLVTACFMILGARVLQPLGLVPTDQDLYSAQGQFLSLIHPSLLAVYKMGIFVALFGVIYGVFEVWNHTVYELLHAIFPRVRLEHRSILRITIPLYACLGGLLVIWVGMKTIAIVTLVAPLTGLLGCGIWCLAMVWVDKRLLPAPYRMSKLLLCLTIIGGLLMTSMGLYVAVRNL
jgi:Mn2+/Fe2+ NRAMP family transporter